MAIKQHEVYSAKAAEQCEMTGFYPCPKPIGSEVYLIDEKIFACEQCKHGANAPSESRDRENMQREGRCAFLCPLYIRSRRIDAYIYRKDNGNLLVTPCRITENGLGDPELLPLRGLPCPDNKKITFFYEKTDAQAAFRKYADQGITVLEDTYEIL